MKALFHITYALYSDSRSHGANKEVHPLQSEEYMTRKEREGYVY